MHFLMIRSGFFIVADKGASGGKLARRWLTRTGRIGLAATFLTTNSLPQKDFNWQAYMKEKILIIIWNKSK
jgi:hypothetical protein